MQTVAIWAVGAVGALQLAAAWWMVRALRAHQQLDGRVAHLADALSLLTETSEAGFKAAAAEIGRLSEALPASNATAPTAANRRVTSARRRGRSVDQIAADEGMSVGEVGLRLRLDAAAHRRGPSASVGSSGEETSPVGRAPRLQLEQAAAAGAGRVKAGGAKSRRPAAAAGAVA